MSNWPGVGSTLTLSVLIVIGCSKGADVPSGEGLGLAIGNPDCLSGAGADLQNYFSGTGTKSGIHSVWTCATQLLLDFTQYTTGANSNGYTAAELQGFLSKYYFQNNLSDNVINTTLKLKQAVVGGADSFVTRGEIQLLIQAIGILDAGSAELFPVVNNLFTNADLLTPESDWFNTYRVLGSVLNQISGFLGQNGQSYAFSDFGGLLQAWAAQLNLPSNSFVYQLVNLVPVLGPGKAILIGGSSTSVAPQEWQPLFSALASGYSDYRMYFRITPTGDFSTLIGGARLLWIGQGILGLLNVAVERRPTNQIPLSEIQNFLSVLQTSGHGPQLYTSAQLTSAVQFLLNQVFTAPQTPQDILGPTTVAQIGTLLNNWNAYDSALANQNFSSVPDFTAAVSPSGTPLTLDNHGRMQLPPNGSGIFHEYSVIFAVVEWIGLQGGAWPVSQSAFNTIVSNWLSFLHSMNLLTTTQSSIADQLIQEADLFVMSSDGALQLEKSEAFQYGIYALSSYRSSLLLNATTSSCNGDAACISSGFSNNLGTLLSNFPNLLNWLNADSSRWETFSQEVSNVAGANQWLMQFMVMHFIETYMERFDQNHDQLIDLSESLVAFPIFQPSLDILLPEQGLPASFDDDVYTYMFKFGTAPTNLSQDFGFVLWTAAQSSWAYEADRSILVGILNSLNSLDNN